MKTNQKIMHTLITKYIYTLKEKITVTSFMALLGLFLLIYYFYFRVIVEKVPKNVPLPFTMYTFILLFCIILMYSYVLFRMYNPKKPPQFILKLLSYIQKLYLPFHALDENFRNNSYVKKILEKIYKSFGSFAYVNNFFDEHGSIKYFHFSFMYAPRFILLLLLGFDVMYFARIEYLYYFSFLAFIPLIFQYFVYMMKNIAEEKIDYLDENFYVVVTSKNTDDFDFYHMLQYYMSECGLLKARNFINIQVNELKKMYEFSCIETEEARDSYAKKIGLDKLPYQVLNKPNKDKYSIEIAKEFYKWIYPTIFIGGFIQTYEFTVLHYQLKEKYQRLIFAGYLFCWSYVFFVTFIGIDLLLEILFNIKSPNEPFF